MILVSSTVVTRTSYFRDCHNGESIRFLCRGSFYLVIRCPASLAGEVIRIDAQNWAILFGFDKF